MKILNSQIQRIHTLLPEVIKNDTEQKKALVQQFTGDWNRTSTKDLSLDQANELIVKLGGKPIHCENWAFFDAKNNKHRYILSVLLQAGWAVWNGDKNCYVADLYRLSEFLKSDKSPVKKPLNKMNDKELSKVIFVLEKIASK
jgi:hypothetical protein